MRLFRNLYVMLRYSGVYPLYLRIIRPSIFIDFRREVNFYALLLRGIPGKVFDIGANVGDKAFKFSALGRQVVAVDPDVHNIQILQKRFSGNQRVTVVQAAVSNLSGNAMFHVSTPGSPSNTLSDKWKAVLENPQMNRWSKKYEFSQTYEVPCLTLDGLIETHGVPGYIKIDVEGHELAVLEGLNRPVPLISFEANFPEFKSETMACVQRLMYLNDQSEFNISDDRFAFLWEQPVKGSEVITWLKDTSWVYFEVYCFSKKG